MSNRPPPRGRRPTANSHVTVYCLRTDTGDVDLRFLPFVLSKGIVRMSVRTALVVGTILTIINQGDVYLAGRVTHLILLKTLLTYIVPYCVATFGALSTAKAKRVQVDGHDFEINRAPKR